MATPTQIDRLGITPSTGTVDDEDNSNDEREDENEPPVRERDDRTEALAEFELDDEDDPNESGGTLRIDDQAGAAAIGDDDGSSELEDDDGMDDEVYDDDVDGKFDDDLEDDLEDDDGSAASSDGEPDE